MATYRVKCRGQVDEIYEVEADSFAEAMSKWADGLLVNSEAWDVSPESADLVDD